MWCLIDSPTRQSDSVATGQKRTPAKANFNENNESIQNKGDDLLSIRHGPGVSLLRAQVCWRMRIKIVDSGSDRHIVQVFNEAEDHVFQSLRW